jgi:hypothetical protein
LTPDGQVKLTTVPITDENVALNVLESFLNVAQRRGVFAIDESAKIYECIMKFQRNVSASASASSSASASASASA